MVAYKGVSGAIKVEQCSSKDTIIDIVSDFAGLSAHTNVLFVSTDGNGVDGLTWETAYTTLQTALEAVTNSSSN